MNNFTKNAKQPSSSMSNHIYCTLVPVGFLLCFVILSSCILVIQNNMYGNTVIHVMCMCMYVHVQVCVYRFVYTCVVCVMSFLFV